MNRLYFGDNLKWLSDRKEFPDASVDLVYLDPPFNSNADYNVLFREPSGQVSQAQFHAFTDTWSWADAADTYHQFIDTCRNVAVVELMEALHSFLKHSPMMAYLAMMAPRLVELHRVLKSTGSLYLHCDPTASHFLKMLLDGVFGPRSFRNEIIWKRSSAHSDTKQGMRRCGRIHDVLLFYADPAAQIWNPQYTPYTKDYIESEYRHVTADRKHYKETDVTARKPGGDTEFEWRVKRPAGGTARWQADLENEYRNPKPEWEYKGVRPYEGRYWAYSKANLIELWNRKALKNRCQRANRCIARKSSCRSKAAE